MDLRDVVKNTLTGLALGAVIDAGVERRTSFDVEYQKPDFAAQALEDVENTRDNALYFDPTPEPEFAAVADQEPTPAAVLRAERAKDDWIKIADLPIEPGVYKTFDRQSRRICVIVVYPANKAESRMEYGIHCGVDTTPKGAE